MEPSSITEKSLSPKLSKENDQDYVQQFDLKVNKYKRILFKKQTEMQLLKLQI